MVECGRGAGVVVVGVAAGGESESRCWKFRMPFSPARRVSLGAPLAGTTRSGPGTESATVRLGSCSARTGLCPGHVRSNKGHVRVRSGSESRLDPGKISSNPSRYQIEIGPEPVRLVLESDGGLESYWVWSSIGSESDRDGV